MAWYEVIPCEWDLEYTDYICGEVFPPSYNWNANKNANKWDDECDS